VVRYLGPASEKRKPDQWQCLTPTAIKTLIGAGFSETKAEAMIDAMGESQDALATKADIAVVKAEIDALRSDLKALVKAVNERATNADLREQELRIRLHLYTVAIVVIGVLAALELVPR
jgi:hypothetical protein